MKSDEDLEEEFGDGKQHREVELARIFAAATGGEMNLEKFTKTVNLSAVFDIKLSLCLKCGKGESHF